MLYGWAAALTALSSDHHIGGYFLPTIPLPLVSRSSGCGRARGGRLAAADPASERRLAGRGTGRGVAIVRSTSNRPRLRRNAHRAYLVGVGVKGVHGALDLVTAAVLLVAPQLLLPAGGAVGRHGGR